MEKPAIILFLKMLNKDLSYKEFYFSPGSTECDNWIFLKDKGYVVMKNLESTTKYDIALSNYGLSLIDEDSLDDGAVSSIMEDLG